LVLREALAGSPAPVIYHGDRTLPAASLWVGARNTVRQLRDADVPPGARLRFYEPDPLSLAVLAAAALSGGFHLELAEPGGDDAVLPTAVVLHGQAAGAGTPRITVSGIEGLHVPDGPNVTGPGITAVGVRRSSEELAQDVQSGLQRLGVPHSPQGHRPLGVHRCAMPHNLPSLVDDLLVPFVAAEFLVFQDLT